MSAPTPQNSRTDAFDSPMVSSNAQNDRSQQQGFAAPIRQDGNTASGQPHLHMPSL